MRWEDKPYNQVNFDWSTVTASDNVKSACSSAMLKRFIKAMKRLRYNKKGVMTCSNEQWNEVVGMWTSKYNLAIE